MFSVPASAASAERPSGTSSIAQPRAPSVSPSATVDSGRDVPQSIEQEARVLGREQTVRPVHDALDGVGRRHAEHDDIAASGELARRPDLLGAEREQALHGFAAAVTEDGQRVARRPDVRRHADAHRAEPDEPDAFEGGHQIDIPPSTFIWVPLVNTDSSLAR